MNYYNSIKVVNCNFINYNFIKVVNYSFIKDINYNFIRELNCITLIIDIIIIKELINIYL